MIVNMSSSDVTPEVSVLMAVYNGGHFLEPALRSMMNQTLRNIEIIVIDDGSTDDTPEVLARLAAEDMRIRVDRPPSNLRLPRALNHGLSLVRAPLVARMDADDLSEPDRLEIQKRYMDAHPSVSLVGTGFRRIDEHDREFDTKVDARDAFAVRWIARLIMPLVHPTFMFRAQLPSGEVPRYDPAWSHSEDYDLQARLLERGEGDLVLLPNLLLSWRAHSGSITGSTWSTCQQQGLAISDRLSRAMMPADVADALMPFRRAFYLGDRVPVADIFAGFRALAAYDAARDPARRTWIRRQSAKLAKHALTRGGYRSAEIVRAFLGPGRDFLADMGMRTLEAKHLLPAVLASEPKVIVPSGPVAA